MKTFLLSVLICSLCIINITCEDDICEDIYKCADLENNMCKLSTYNHTSGVTTHSLKQCNSTSYCVGSLSTNYTCQPKPKLLNKHDEQCETNADCYGECDTSSKKCKPLQDDTPCTSHYACDYTSYCDDESNKCLPLKTAGANCFNSEECPLGYLCSKLQDDSKQCVKMFSIETGEYADDDELCISGKKSDNNICIDIQSTNQGKECKTNEDCPGEYDIKTDKANGTVECECNLEGKKFCEYGTTSQEWKTFVNVFNEEIEKVNVNKFYTAALRDVDDDYDYSEDELKNKFWKISAIQNAYRDYDVKYKDVDSCVIDYFKDAQYVKLPIAFITILLAVLL